jgi:hypothetical protein
VISLELNVTRLDGSVKRKSQASADFLGVSAIPDKVVDVVLHSDNNFDLFWSGLRIVFAHPTNANDTVRGRARITILG